MHPLKFTVDCLLFSVVLQVEPICINLGPQRLPCTWKSLKGSDKRPEKVLKQHNALCNSKPEAACTNNRHLCSGESGDYVNQPYEF